MSESNDEIMQRFKDATKGLADLERDLDRLGVKKSPKDRQIEQLQARIAELESSLHRLLEQMEHGPMGPNLRRTLMGFVRQALGLEPAGALGAQLVSVHSHTGPTAVAIVESDIVLRDVGWPTLRYVVEDGEYEVTLVLRRDISKIKSVPFTDY